MPKSLKHMAVLCIRPHAISMAETVALSCDLFSFGACVVRASLLFVMLCLLWRGCEQWRWTV